MIQEITMYAAKCDNCGKEWEDENNGWCAMTDELTMKNQLMEDEWHKEDNKHYCPDCWSYDDNDNIILRKL